ncbi:MAG: GTP 3',8-cyclase MoaA [Smithellaceae bacterium]
MLDKFNREINYLRISVTDKCNLRCIYCMPEEGLQLKQHKDILRYEQIEQIVKESVSLGITKVRLTGGEPLIKKDVEILIEKIAGIKGIRELCLTTNGILLARKAKKLRQAGLTSINISLDTLQPEKYKEITRGGNLTDVLKGIDQAIWEGFKIKLNMVVLKGKNEDEIDDIRRFCLNKNIETQLINHFNLRSNKHDEYFFDRPPKCKHCNRIRLLSDGVLKPCLHSETEYKVNFANVKESLEKAILAKPERGLSCSSRRMFEIGG